MQAIQERNKGEINMNRHSATIRDARDDDYDTGRGLKKTVAIVAHRRGNHAWVSKVWARCRMPFPKGSPARVPLAGGRGSAPYPPYPLGERKGTFDAESGGWRVESAFALLLERVTEPRLTPEERKTKGKANEENDQRDGGQRLRPSQQPGIPRGEH